MENDIKKKIGFQIKIIRNKVNISQLELSNRSGLDRTYITSVENGKRNISIINLEKISKALGISLKDFFNNDEFTNNWPSSK